MAGIHDAATRRDLGELLRDVPAGIAHSIHRARLPACELAPRVILTLGGDHDGTDEVRFGDQLEEVERHRAVRVAAGGRCDIARAITA